MEIRSVTRYIKASLLMLVSMITLTSCMQKSELLDLNNMPENAPKNVQARFAWGLWNLDLLVIKDTLAAGAKPYEVEKVVNVASLIPTDKKLSPYALLLEGYYARIYMVENQNQIQEALNQLYACVEFLIRQNISVDYGICLLENNPTMREFVRNSIIHLHEEKTKEGFLDGEGLYALKIVQKIQTIIDEYQPIG